VHEGVGFGLARPSFFAAYFTQIVAQQPKAYRWVAEMEEAGGFAGPTPVGEMFRAVASFYEEAAAQTEGYSAALSSFLDRPRPE